MFFCQTKLKIVVSFKIQCALSMYTSVHYLKCLFNTYLLFIKLFIGGKKWYIL